jgi:hypothetical protein
LFCSLQDLQPRTRHALDRVKRKAGIILLMASASASGSAFAQGTGGITLSDAVPEGFEALMDAQTLVVELRFNQRNVGTTMVTADADTLTFEEPETVVELLTGIKDPDTLTELLRNTYPTNGHLVCYSRDEPAGCGQVEPNPVAIIYNTDLLQLDLYIEQSLQNVQSADSARYLARPEERTSSIFSLEAIASNTSDGLNSIDLAARTLSSYGSGNLFTEADYNSRTSHTRLRTARLTHLFRDHSLKAGSYTFESGSTLTNINLLGASFESSLSTRIDLDDAFSSELAIYLPRRAQVQMVVDERIYVSQSYSAGNQAINTRSLPSGTYEVEIRIFDPVSGVRSETRLFTKSTSIPARGETVYGLTFGIPLKEQDLDVIPRLTDISLGALNIAKRITDHTAWRLSVMGANNIALAEAQYLLLGTNLSLQFSVSAGSQQLKAGALRLGYVNPNMSLSLGSTWFKANETLLTDETLESIIPNEFSQYSASWTRTLEKYSLNARYTQRTVGSTPDTEKSTEEFNVVLRRLVYRSGSLRANMRASFQSNNEGNSFGLGFTVSVSESSTRTDVGLDATRSAQDEYSGVVNLSHNLQSDLHNPLRWETTLRADIEEKTEALGVSGKVGHQRFGLTFNSDWISIDAEESARNSAVRFSTQLGIDNHGFAMGGADVGQSGAILQITGPQQDLEFDYYINGVRAGVGRVGQTRFIGLQPLREYIIKLVTRSALISALTEDTFRFTVYPGAVYRINAEVRVRVLLIATIVDEDGELVRNGFVNRVSNPVLVDSEGFISAEVSPGEQLNVVRRGLPDCTISVPKTGAEDNMQILDAPLACINVKF